MFEAEVESLRLRPKFWPRGHFGLEDLTSLIPTILWLSLKVSEHRSGWKCDNYSQELS